MSYVDQGHVQQRRPGGLSPLIMLLVIGFVIFLFLGTNNRPPGPTEGPDSFPRKIESVEAPIDNLPPNQLPAHPDAKDWEIDELPADVAAKPSKSTAKGRTQNGDWSMEEVESATEPANKPINRTTKQGDWEMEEVGGKK